MTSREGDRIVVDEEGSQQRAVLEMLAQPSSLPRPT